MASTSTDSLELESWALRAVAGSISRELPDYKGKAGVIRVAPVVQAYFRLFRIFEVSAPSVRPVFIAYRADNTTMIVLSGRQHALRLVASIDPIPFRSAEDVLEFSAFADRITADDPVAAIPLDSASDIEKVVQPANGDREVVEALQNELRDVIRPVEKFVLPYGLQERFFVILQNNLIARTRTIASGGIFWRQDEVVFGQLPTAPSQKS
ncbi:hypothetical protein F183_A30130 [Bryobacterales bacterium F-183]|nr:hypothetical protein F183_A30130 [Bryobacterales bacterium F-183]